MAKKKHPKDKMEIRGFTIDQKLSEALEAYAKSRDRSVSWVIREALKNFLPLKYYNDPKGILRSKK